MKTYLTIVRHAQTVANQKRLFAGKMEVDVSEEGYRQIASLEKRLSQEKFDVVYSSPNIRAVQTVAGIAQKQGLPFVMCICRTNYMYFADISYQSQYQIQSAL